MNFEERYKNYSNTSLLRILEDKEDYQPEAVATAKRLLTERELTEDEKKSLKN